MILIFCITQVEARFDVGLWCNGRLMFEDGRIEEGLVSYDLKFEVVRIRQDGITKAYTAESVAFFEINDPIKQMNRRFIALPFPVYEGYRRLAFFEVISHGALALLRKSEYVRRPRATEDMRAPHVYLNVVCNHTYFMHDPEEGLIQIMDFHQQVLPRMHEHRRAIDNYIRECHLKLNRLHEQVRVFNLYNQLAATEDKVALHQSAISDRMVWE